MSDLSSRRVRFFKYFNLRRNAARIIVLFSPNIVIVAFILLYIAAATVFQIRSDIPPWRENAPIDLMNGSLIWMVAIIALVMAMITRRDPIRSLMWLAGAAALGFVALDEIFGIHEAAQHIRDDDDAKIFMAVGAALALVVLVRVQRVNRLCLRLIVAGYTTQLLYLISDLGDGDFFDLTFGHLDALRYVEEYLELLAMSFYFAAFMLVLLQEIETQVNQNRPRDDL